jgi:DNA-binding NarL/FixJ family response regulator
MILLASNNPKLITRWKRALRGKHATCVVSEKSALKESLSPLKPSVLLLDLRLPRLRAARDLLTIQQLSRTTKIIVLSDTVRTDEAITVLQAGAKGYTNCAISGLLLQKAIRAVMRGELWAGRQILSELIEEIISSGNHRKFLREKYKLRWL